MTPGTPPLVMPAPPWWRHERLVIKMTSHTVCVSSGQFLAGRRRTCKSTVCRGRGGIWWKEPKRELKPWQIRSLSKMLLVQSGAFMLICRTIESRASRKTGAQGAAGGSGSEASFHDLTLTRSLRRDLGSCCWNKGSGERRRAIMQLCVLGFLPLCTSGPPTSPRSHSFQLFSSGVHPPTRRLRLASSTSFT